MIQLVVSNLGERCALSIVRHCPYIKLKLKSKITDFNFLGLIKLILFFSLSPACNNQQKELPLPFINKPDFTPEWINKTDTAYKNIHTIPAFSFTDQDHKTITEKDMDGKIYVADFIFTRCGSICPTMTQNMGILQQKFKRDNDILLLSYSVTPDIDSVPVLKKYAEKKGIISGKWHLLTGNKDQIYTLAKKEYFAGDKIGFYEPSNRFLHTENFLLIDKHRRIRGVYNGTLPVEMDRLADDIITLEKEDIN